MSAAVGEHAARRRRRGAVGLVAVLLGVLLAVGTGTLSASAHAELLGTTPEEGAMLEEAPSHAELRFNEPVQLIDGAIRLFPGDGSTPLVLEARTVDSTVTINLPDDLADGSYALSYRIVSADGHPIGGAIAFQIGAGTPTSAAPDLAELDGTPAATETAVSFLTVLQYLGLLVFAGLLFFDRIVLRTRGGADRGVRRLLVWAFGAALGASVVLVPLSALRIVGGHLWELLTPGVWSPGFLWPPVIAVVLVAAAGTAALSAALGSTSVRGRVAGVVCAGIAVCAPVLVGHTRTVEPGWLMIAADVGHLLAGAFWAGGVLGLLRFLAAARPGTAAKRGTPASPPRTDPDTAARVVVRFSRFALASVILLAVSGTIMAVLIVGTWDAVLGTGYGRTLLLKLGIVAAVVALAAWNRTRLLPRITARPTAALQWASLGRILSYEAALLVAVIAITGFLTNSSPAHDHHDSVATAPSATQTPVHAESQGLTVDGTISPTTTGQNTLIFRLEYDDAPVATGEVSVDARLPDQDLGPFPATVQLDADTGDYKATVTLPVSGSWQLQVSARIDTYTQPIAIVPITIG
ncbi:copper resistance protein CopC [Microbacterium sp. JB110]|uniref:copper resistance protein CopC n=1 Tax=Microbacterium sp. JB110 TaxID=2024477 RepID=UPI00097F32A2|nr:copper resistance protein CopC [Microbacterium sp. JB110]RCS61202.1 hypothetical protein CIK77_06675 [Microbacterium sp. JB110]SJM69380.1 Copper resistance protein CopC [Frigoribacterium sp. JB110]